MSVHNTYIVYSSQTAIFGQLLPEIDRLLSLCKIGCEKLIESTDISKLNQPDVDIENCELVRNLREQLLTAHQLLTEKLPVDTKIGKSCCDDVFHNIYLLSNL